MEYTQFESLVLSRQSCRDFADTPVEKEKLDKIMQLALLSPSACNSQPWKIYCAYTPEKVEQVKNTLQVMGHNKFLNGAKAFIAVADKEAILKLGSESRFDRNRFVKYDVGEYIAYLTLAAKTVGLDTCIIGWMDEKQLAKVLGLSKNEKCKIVVAVGYSNQPVREKKRFPPQEKIIYLD